MGQHQVVAHMQAAHASGLANLTAHLDRKPTSGVSVAFGLKQSSWLLKRFMRLTDRLMSAVMTTSRQLRRTKAMQGSTNHSNSAKICRAKRLCNNNSFIGMPGCY